MKSASIIRITLICPLLALIMFCAQVETADEIEEDSIFAPTYLSYDDIYRDFTTKKMCKRCHPAIWREWERSMHAQAWEDPIYQEAASQVEDREKTCESVPRPRTDPDHRYRQNAEATSRRSEVWCLLYRMPYRRTRRNARTTQEHQSDVSRERDFRGSRQAH